jgi:prepilin-type N-terminal cleavage/methylation domain-containing protein
MLYRLRQRSTDQSGFTLIELLVVILIIGILAAIAIPSLLSQKSKAYDAGAKELARSAYTTVETYATDHNGEYTGVNGAGGLTILHEYDASIPTSSAAAKGGAYLEAPTAAAETFSVTAVAASTGDKFTISRSATGEVSRTCVVKSEANKGGCPTGSW